MPEIQIIDRRDDPGLNLIQRAAAERNRSREAKELLQVQKLQAQINAKNAQNEEQKLKFNQDVQFFDTLEKLDKMGIKDERTIQLLSQTFGSEGTFERLAQIGEAVRTRPPGLAERKTEAEIGNIGAQQQLREAQTSREQAVADAISGSAGDRVDAISADGTPTMAPGARAQALTGEPTQQESDFVISQITPSGPTFVNRSARASLAGAETEAREAAKLNAQLLPVRNTMNAFRVGLNRSIQEIGGLPDLAAAAFVKGTLKGIEANLLRLPETQAFLRERDAAALNLASFVNRGRPTEPDAEAMRKVLPNITYPEATNNALNRFVDSLMLQGSSAEGPGNAPVRQGAKQIADVGERFRKEGIAAGLTLEEINAELERYYERLGF